MIVSFLMGERDDRREKGGDRRKSKKPWPEHLERRTGADRRDTFDYRWIRRQQRPIYTFLVDHGVYVSFSFSLLTCLIFLAIPGPPRLNHIPMTVGIQDVGICISEDVLIDPTADPAEDKPPEPEEEATEEEGEGDLEKKKKKPRLMLSLPLMAGPKPPSIDATFTPTQRAPPTAPGHDRSVRRIGD